MGLFSFRKAERLSKKKYIQELFNKGSSFYFAPFKIFVLQHPEASQSCHQVLISVSSRHFKKAVDRNLIKRRIREAYRLQKNKLPLSPKFIIGFIYVSKEILSFEEIKAKMLLSLGKTERAGKNLTAR